MAATKQLPISLTGIKPTGTPHLGNYVGAIKPALKLAESSRTALYFIADYHALTSVTDPKEMERDVYEVAATWLASGLDPEKVIFYRQSDIPEVFEINWILSCVAPKGLLNRAHAYKAKVQANIEAKVDPDDGVNMGVFGYPVLMAADILTFDAEVVPVGSDQVQHVEIARDIAGSFNHLFGDVFVPPKHQVPTRTAAITGLDGRKMSKSYGNTVPLFVPSKQLRKTVMKFVTDSSAADAPKDPDTSPLYAIYTEFASEDECATLREKMKAGMMWGHVKEELFNVLDRELGPKRERYDALLANKDEIDRLLKQGAERARQVARRTLARARKAIGMQR